MSKGLVELLSKELGSISLVNNGNQFAEIVIATARKHNIALKSIPELKYADLDSDGNITAKEIAALIHVAHQKRTGNEFDIVNNNTGYNGRAVRNPHYDATITSADIHSMLDPDVITKAKNSLQLTPEIPTMKELLNAIGKDTMDTLKVIKGGIEVKEDWHKSSSTPTHGCLKQTSPIR